MYACLSKIFWSWQVVKNVYVCENLLSYSLNYIKYVLKITILQFFFFFSEDVFRNSECFSIFDQRIPMGNLVLEYLLQKKKQYHGSNNNPQLSEYTVYEIANAQCR